MGSREKKQIRDENELKTIPRVFIDLISEDGFGICLRPSKKRLTIQEAREFLKAKQGGLSV